jgi:hypothetical protein
MVKVTISGLSPTFSSGWKTVLKKIIGAENQIVAEVYLVKIPTPQRLRHTCIILICQNDHLSFGKLMHEFGQFLECFDPIPIRKVAVEQTFKESALTTGEIFGHCHNFVREPFNEVVVSSIANILHAIVGPPAASA